MPRLSRLDRDDLPADPLDLLRAWLDEAKATGMVNPAAMTLATAGGDGGPSARTVLLRGLDARGLAFYTNRGSRKGRDLAANPRACAVLYWRELDRQVIVTGPVEVVEDAESDAYFAGRRRGHRISAWASDQGAALPDRAALEAGFAAAEARFPGEDVPRPPSWGGYRIGLDAIEFWQSGDDRLHDRFVCAREGDGWTVTRLAP